MYHHPIWQQQYTNQKTDELIKEAALSRLATQARRKQVRAIMAKLSNLINGLGKQQHPIQPQQTHAQKSL